MLMEETICPILVEDIGCWTLCKRKNIEFYSIGSRELDLYMQVSGKILPVIMETIDFFDGKHSIEWIQDYFLKEKQLEIDVQKVYERFANAGLICGVDPKHKKSELDIMGVDIFNVRFRKLSERGKKRIGNVWNICVFISFLLFITAGIEIIRKLQFFRYVLSQSFVYDESYILGGILVMVAAIFGLITHELGHCFTAVKFGLQPSEFHLNMYSGMIPKWYVKIREMYTLPVKQRIAVLASGMISNFIFICVVIIIALEGNFELREIQLLSKIIYTFSFNILFSLVPINLSDGYFIFSWIFGMPNLRIRMFDSLKKIFHGIKCKVSAVMIVYFLLFLCFFVINAYNGIYWIINIVKEIWYQIDIMVLKYSFIGIFLLFYILTVYRFVKKFSDFMKSKE